MRGYRAASKRIRVRLNVLLGGDVHIMAREKSNQFDVLIFCRFITLFIILVFCHPNILRAQQHSVSVPTLPLSVPAGTDLQAKCLECHNDYRENHHPIGVAPPNAESYPFPLYNGKITCMTCHTDDHASGGIGFLRGGPYKDRREVCFKCHSQEEYANIDPHIMLDKGGKIRSVNGRPVCLFCHSILPDPATDRTKDVRFRADVAFLCWRCHPVMASPTFFKTHFLKKPSVEMGNYIKEKEQLMLVTIPLVPRDRITCSTCHNPHQKGVILYGPSASGADQEYRLRLPEGKLCTVCHNFN
jgi:predicted CXXCH cytochrome family protein